MGEEAGELRRQVEFGASGRALVHLAWSFGPQHGGGGGAALAVDAAALGAGGGAESAGGTRHKAEGVSEEVGRDPQCLRQQLLHCRFISIILY